MKNYRKLMPLVLIVVMALSWYSIVTNAIEETKAYNNYLSKARKYAETGITKYAVENYNKALEIKPSVDIYIEVANYYESQGKVNEQLSWCEDFFQEYPTEPKAYDCLLKSYLEQKDYTSCYDVLCTAEKRNITSNYMKGINEKLAYTFQLDYTSYDDVGVYSNKFCPVKSKDSWGFVDRYGNQEISAKYVSVGAFTSTNFAPVVNSEGEPYFIDKTGSKILASKDKYKSFGLLVNGIILAQKESEKYIYVDESFNNLFGEYDNATTMNNGVALIQKGDKWKLIDNKGKEISSTEFDGVIVDEKNIAYRNERIFVKSKDSYIMVDSAGKQIGSQTYENALPFSDTSYAAVKINGSWCFVDKNGKIKSDKKYENARSFLNGLAAVKINGKWGFVDSNEEIKIEPQFFGAKDFNEKGSCFVMTGDKWQLLKLYRLNREG